MHICANTLVPPSVQHQIVAKSIPRIENGEQVSYNVLQNKFQTVFDFPLHTTNGVEDLRRTLLNCSHTFVHYVNDGDLFFPMSGSRSVTTSNKISASSHGAHRGRMGFRAGYGLTIEFDGKHLTESSYADVMDVLTTELGDYIWFTYPSKSNGNHTKESFRVSFPFARAITADTTESGHIALNSDNCPESIFGARGEYVTLHKKLQRWLDGFSVVYDKQCYTFNTFRCSKHTKDELDSKRTPVKQDIDSCWYFNTPAYNDLATKCIDQHPYIGLNKTADHHAIFVESYREYLKGMFDGGKKPNKHECQILGIGPSWEIIEARSPSYISSLDFKGIRGKTTIDAIAEHNLVQSNIRKVQTVVAKMELGEKVSRYMEWTFDDNWEISRLPMWSKTKGVSDINRLLWFLMQRHNLSFMHGIRYVCKYLHGNHSMRGYKFFRGRTEWLKVARMIRAMGLCLDGYGNIQESVAGRDAFMDLSLGFPGDTEESINHTFDNAGIWMGPGPDGSANKVPARLDALKKFAIFAAGGGGHSSYLSPTYALGEILNAALEYLFTMDPTVRGIVMNRVTKIAIERLGEWVTDLDTVVTFSQDTTSPDWGSFHHVDVIVQQNFVAGKPKKVELLRIEINDILHEVLPAIGFEFEDFEDFKSTLPYFILRAMRCKSAFIGAEPRNRLGEKISDRDTRKLYTFKDMVRAMVLRPTINGEDSLGVDYDIHTWPNYKKGIANKTIPLINTTTVAYSVRKSFPHLVPEGYSFQGFGDVMMMAGIHECILNESTKLGRIIKSDYRTHLVDNPSIKVWPVTESFRIRNRAGGTEREEHIRIPKIRDPFGLTPTPKDIEILKLLNSRPQLLWEPKPDATKQLISDLDEVLATMCNNLPIASDAVIYTEKSTVEELTEDAADIEHQVAVEELVSNGLIDEISSKIIAYGLPTDEGGFLPPSALVVGKRYPLTPLEVVIYNEYVYRRANPDVTDRKWPCIRGPDPPE